MNSLSTLASLFLIQARRFIKFVKQVFQQQQTSSSELWNRWHLIDRSTVSTKKGVAVEKYEMKTLSNESQKGVPLYVRTSFLPLLPSRQTCTLLLTRHHCAKRNKNTARLFVCEDTVIWPWMLFSVWQPARKQSRHSNTENVSLGKKKLIRD